MEAAGDKEEGLREGVKEALMMIFLEVGLLAELGI